MSNATEQRTVFEVGGDLTITGYITRVSIKGGKIEIFSIPEGVNLEEIKGTQEYIDKYFPIVKASTLSLLKTNSLSMNPKLKNRESSKMH